MSTRIALPWASTLLATTLLAACGGSDDDSTVAPTSNSPITVAGTKASVRTPQGAMDGTAGDSSLSFRGIPYALAPTGDRRWKPPQATAAWTGTLDASKFAKHCPQENAQTDANANEDCLYLNVYTPKALASANPGGKRAVMVWIHGGANAFGASDFYDPTPLVETGDVIVVTLNYRVGALGFLAHPALEAEGHKSVNYGVMDQQLALAWVRDNIASFGGDAGNVTIFGESAGGLNVTTHLISADSRGLFHKAIIESGGYLLQTPTLAQSQDKGKAFATRIGCADQSTACLRGKTVAEILANEGTVNTAGAAYHQATQDGTVLPEAQASALASGRFAKVPVLVGANSNEGRLFFGAAATAADYQGTVDFYSTKNGRAPATTATTYPLANYTNAMEAASAVLGDAEFACPSRRTAQWFANWVPTYAYEFSDPASAARSGHFAEVYYLHNYKNIANFGWNGPADSQKLSVAMRRYWTQFAKNGTPNSADTPVWNNYRPSTDNLQLLVPGGPREDSARENADYATRHFCSYWD